MSKIYDALNFLKKDVPVVHQQYVGPLQWMSLLQRNDVTLSDLLDTFDPQPDDESWLSEYSQNRRGPQLQLYRKRIAFLRDSRKEFYEDYDTSRSDVDFMRLLEVPYSDSRYYIDWGLEEMKDK